MPLNPYESPQTTEPTPLAHARAKWERVQNTSYDRTPFPATILFRGTYRIRDFRALIQKLHRSSVAGWFVATCIWLVVGMLGSLQISWVRLQIVEKLMSSSFIAIIFILPLLLATARMRRWEKDQSRSNSFQGQIGPDGISLAETSNPNPTGVISATEFLPWTELFTIEQVPPSGRVIVGLTSKENRSDLPLPTRVMLVAKSDKDPTVPKEIKARNDFHYFHEIICLDPTFFANEQEWRTLIDFLRKHLIR